MKKLPNSRMILGFALVVALANPALVARADGEKAKVKVTGAKTAAKWFGGKVKDLGKAYVDTWKDHKPEEKKDEAADTGMQNPPPVEAPPPPPREDDDYYYWTKESTGPLTRKPGDDFLTFTLTSKRMHRTTTWQQVDVPYSTYTCPTTSGNGSGNNWNGFFNISPRDPQKASALAATILGVGEPTARKLIENNAFPKKPRSWAEFTAVIADQDTRIRGLYQNVVVQFGKKNREALKYGSYDAEDCQFTTVTRKGWQEVPVDLEVGAPSTYTTRVRIQNAPLLPKEWENWSATYDGDRFWVNPPEAFEGHGAPYAYNFDKTSETRFTKSLTATGTRQQVRPWGDLTVYTKVENGQIVIEVTDNNFSGVSNLGQRTIYWTVMQNYNLGDKEIRSGSFVMNGNWTKFQTGVTKGNFQQGRLSINGRVVEAYTKARIGYTGSAYYNQERGEERKSNKQSL